MRHPAFISCVKLSMFSLSAVFIGIAILIGVMVTGIGSQPAKATAAFAGQTKKACVYCHVSPGGGGALTAAGKKFKASGNKM